MKGKLHKMVSGYILSLNGDIDDPYAIVNKQLAKDHEWHRLSLKNCQAIERGYDLDELAYSSFPNGTYEKSEIDLGLDMYKLGFQKALEILGDKKFSEEQLRESFLHVQNDPTFDVFKQSLQQTEWDVEIEMEWIQSTFILGNPHQIPKLDDDGCLILKRI